MDRDRGLADRSVCERTCARDRSAGARCGAGPVESRWLGSPKFVADGLAWAQLGCVGVARLVETELDPAGEGDGGEQAPALVADRPGNLDPLGLKCGHGGGDVVGHEIELGPAALLGRVDGELGRREREDQPAAAGVDRPGPEHLGQRRACRAGVVAVEDGVDTVDHGGILAAAGRAVKVGRSRRWVGGMLAGVLMICAVTCSPGAGQGALHRLVRPWIDPEATTDGRSQLEPPEWTWRARPYRLGFRTFAGGGGPKERPPSRKKTRR